MNHRSMPVWIVVVAVFGLLGAPAASAASDSPYLIAKKEFKNRIKSIALSPVIAHETLNLSSSMQSLVEAEASARMNKTKLEVLGIEPYAQLRATMIEQIGGLRTADGVVDPRREASVLDHTKREMRHRHQVDAFAQLSIRVVRAAYADDRAEWDGIKQKVAKSGDGFALFGGPNYQGTIGAASFQLAIYDRSDQLLYLNRGGIEVLQERQGDSLVLIDESTYLQDEKRLKKAVQLAFKGL